MPILIIVDLEDTSCPIEHQEILFNAIPDEGKQLSIINGAPHSFYEESEQEECKTIIVDWLQR